MRRSLPFIIIGVVLLGIASGGYILYRSKLPTPVNIANGLPGAEPTHVRGGAQAPVTIEEFGDFQCPPCGLLSATLLKIERDYGNRIRVIFREFPLAMHAHAFTAACAAEAAGLQGRFWEMHDLLFEHAQYWSKDSPPGSQPTDEINARVFGIFTEYATRSGVDVERFKKDVNGQEVTARIKADQARGASIGVDRTPVLFVNSLKIPFAKFNVEDLHKIIDDELAGKTPDLTTPSPTPAEGPLPQPSSAP
jgi:protein-disulfide isomerase